MGGYRDLFQKDEYRPEVNLTRAEKKALKKKLHKKGNRLQKPQIFVNTMILLFTIFCFVPIVYVFMVSFTEQKFIDLNGYKMFPIWGPVPEAYASKPEKWGVPGTWALTGEAWKYVWGVSDQLLQGLKLTCFESFVGPILDLCVGLLFAYPMTRKEFILKDLLTTYLLLTMFIPGGPIAGYLLNVNVWHLKNNPLVLIIPGIGLFTIVMYRTYMNKNCPEELIEAARIDGCGETRILFQMVFPILVPIIACNMFGDVVGKWNEWSTSMLYFDKEGMVTLQLILMRIERNVNYLQQQAAKGNATPDQIAQMQKLPGDAFKMVMMLSTIIPVLIAFPFFQKYFIKGATIGSVKG